jgi:hypothetical protein
MRAKRYFRRSRCSSFSRMAFVRSIDSRSKASDLQKCGEHFFTGFILAKKNSLTIFGTRTIFITRRFRPRLFMAAILSIHTPHSSINILASLILEKAFNAMCKYNFFLGVLATLRKPTRHDYFNRTSRYRTIPKLDKYMSGFQMFPNFGCPLVI